MFKAILVALNLICLVTAIAQPGQFIFDHYGFEAGFNSREAMDIVTTPNGMVWISSNDGLVRFDSKKFKFYTHNDVDSTSLTNNYCKGLATDKRGRIWVQSDDDLDVFDPGKERFTHIRIADGHNKTRPVYPISFNYDSTADIMWVGTSKGLYFSKNGSLKLEHAYKITSDSIIGQSTINNIVQDGSDFIWVTAWNRIIKLNIRNGKVEHYQLPEKVDGIYNPPNVSNFPSAYLDASKTLWLGCWINGLVSFNTVTKSFNQYCFSDNTKEANTIMDIAQTPGQENKLWVSTAGFGLASFDMDSKKFTSYASPLRNDPFGIQSTTYGLFTGDKKSMWIGSTSGLHRYDYSKQIFNTIDIGRIGKGNQLLPVSSMAIEKNIKKHDEILWFYLPYYGGFKYNLVQKKIQNIPAKVLPYLNDKTAFLDFYIDSKNILWISAVGEGLTGYSIHKDEIIFRAARPFGEIRKWVSSFFEDNQHRLWIGTGQGLFVMDTARKQLLAINTVNNALIKNGLATQIIDITQDELGILWFNADGTDKQIACIGNYNPKNGQLIWVYNERDLTSTNHIPTGLRGIACNGKGKIMVAFYGDGIKWFSTTDANGLAHALNNNNAINSNRIHSLIADKNNNIWFNNSFGLSCYNEATKSVINYNYTVYPLDNTAEPTIFLSQQSGVMYIGQANAIRYFNAQSSNISNEESQLVFSEINVLNKPFLTKGKLLKDGDVLPLNYDEDMVSVEFALLNYSNAADDTYSWILEGWDGAWITSKNNIASYNNLKPGTYTLKVKAANSQGQWTKKPIQLTLKIASPFYQTGWFMVLCAIAVASVINWLVKVRIRRIKEKYQLRNKIAADLHDEIGSTLTSINILSNVSQQAMEQQPQQAREMLHQISMQSKTIQQSMSDIVWSIRPDNEKMGDLVTRMREYAAQTLEQLDIATQIKVSEELSAKILPMEYRKELLLIFKEAINNVAKHAGASRVEVSLENGSQQMHLQIVDNGTWKGFSSGTGTRSMKSRAAVLGGQLSITPGPNGTIVKASLPIP